jgi:thiamine biosynthesis lipoprotein
MGTRAHVIVVGGPAGLADIARTRIEQLESLWSRFRAGSDTSRLNLHAGARVNVARETVELVERAVEGWRLTAGAFDPTLLGPVIRAGYDRSFDLIAPCARPGRSDAEPACAGIETGPGWVRLPAGSGFDPGGIGKGLAADIVAAELMGAGARGVCVNLGGDLRVAGESPGGGTWTVAVEHPGLPDPIARLGLAAGAVATSTTLRRRWHVDGELRHHLIDPSTESPSATPTSLAAVVTGQAWVAEVLAKAVLLARGRSTPDVLAGTGAEALTVDAGGRIRTTPGLAAFLGGATPLAAVSS